MLCQWAVPVHAALAEAFDEHAIWSHPHQHTFLQVGQKTAHGFSDARGQADGVWTGEEDLLGFTRPVDTLIPYRSTALQNEAAVWRCSCEALHQVTMIEQTHFQAAVYKYTNDLSLHLTTAQILFTVHQNYTECYILCHFSQSMLFFFQ